MNFSSGNNRILGGRPLRKPFFLVPVGPEKTKKGKKTPESQTFSLSNLYCCDNVHGARQFDGSVWTEERTAAEATRLKPFRPKLNIGARKFRQEHRFTPNHLFIQQRNNRARVPALYILIAWNRMRRYPHYTRTRGDSISETRADFARLRLPIPRDEQSRRYRGLNTSNREERGPPHLVASGSNLSELLVRAVNGNQYSPAETNFEHTDERNRKLERTTSSVNSF